MKNKKFILVLILVLFATGGVFAQADINNFAPALEYNNVLINFGVGLGPTYGYKMGIPPISAAVDVILPIPVPITVGGIVTYSTWKYDGYLVNVTWTNIGFGIRGMYHLNFAENLDAYAGLTLGYVHQTVKVDSSWGWYGSGYAAEGEFLLGANVGARYFFTSFLGAYAELGYNRLQYINLGLTFKF